MKRVSWSDTQIAKEHVYPKYDYSDYESIDQEPPPQSDQVDGNSPDGELATPLHPWLSSSTPMSPPPPTTESIHSYSPSNLGTVGSFMSMYTLTLPSNNSKKTKTSANKNNQSKETEEPESAADVYANLDSDTAALLF